MLDAPQLAPHAHGRAADLLELAVAPSAAPSLDALSVLGLRPAFEAVSDMLSVESLHVFGDMASGCVALPFRSDEVAVNAQEHRKEWGGKRC